MATSLTSLWNSVKNAGNWVGNNVVKPVVNDFVDYGKGVGYAFEPERLYNTVKATINPSLIETDPKLRQYFLDQPDSPVTARRMLSATAGVISTLAPTMGAGAAANAATPAARLAIGTGARAAQAAVPAFVKGYFDSPSDTLLGGDLNAAARQAAIAGTTAGALNVLFSPKTTSQAAVQLWNQATGRGAMPAAGGIISQSVIPKAAATAADVADNPNAMTFYRGTGGGTDAANLVKSNRMAGQGNALGPGTYFSTDPNIARSYGNNVEKITLPISQKDILTVATRDDLLPMLQDAIRNGDVKKDAIAKAWEDGYPALAKALGKKAIQVLDEPQAGINIVDENLLWNSALNSATGVGRPHNVIQFDELMAKGDYDGARALLRAMPESNPYKQSLTSLMAGLGI